MIEYYTPKTAKDLVIWLCIRQGKGSGYYRGLKKRQLLAIFYKELDKHKKGYTDANG